MIELFKILLIQSLLMLISFPYNKTEAMTMNSDQHVSPEYVELAGKLRADVGKKLAKKYSMHICGITGGLFERVNRLGLSFDIVGPLSKGRLREILIDCAEEFLSDVNADLKIRPYLKNYPFTQNEIEIRLFIQDKNGYDVFDPNISVASARDGYLYYHIAEDKIAPYKSTEEEPYEEALKIVRGEK
jgi:hypothetical protein